MHWLRASIVASLLVGASAGSANAWTNGTAGAGAAAKAPAIAYWDGALVPIGGDITGLRDVASESIERWRRFATVRGYRIDLDETQRVLTLSDAGRFKRFSSARRTIERTLSALAPYVGPQDAPIVVLRASNEDDANVARNASDALGFGLRVHTMVEIGTFAERRAVDARLAESVVRAQLALHAPNLSDWMVDGLASAIAEDVTGRAIIDGDVTTLRTAKRSVSKRYNKSGKEEVDIFEMSGVRPGEVTAPLEADAVCAIARLMENSPADLASVISSLGTSRARAGEPMYRAEERELKRVFGLDVLARLAAAHKKGR